MHVDPLTVAASAVAGAAIVTPIVLWWARRRWSRPPAPLAPPLPPGTVDPAGRFKVIMRDNLRAGANVVCAEHSGARARDYWERLQPEGDEVYEFWDGNKKRGLKRRDG